MRKPIASSLKWSALDLILQDNIKVTESHHWDFQTLSTLLLIKFLIPISFSIPNMNKSLRKILFSCLAAAGTGLWLAEAQEVAEGGIKALYGTSDQGPWHEAKSDFDALLQSPNATGNFPVPGPSISPTATASDTSDGWSWSSK